jgi:hypothetical protein
MGRLEHLYWQVVNVIMRVLLRSPLHRIQSEHRLLLEFTGRRTGKRYLLPVSYWQPEPSELVCLTSASWAVWWRNLDDAQLAVVLRRAKRNAHSRLVTDPELRREFVRGFLAHNPRDAGHYRTTDPVALADDPQTRVIAIALES